MVTKKKSFAIIIACILALTATAAVLFGGIRGEAHALSADADANGWVVGDNVYGVPTLDGVDGYSSFTLDHGGKTINEHDLDLSREISFAFRFKASSGSTDSTYLHLVSKSEIEAWKGATETGAAIKLKVQNGKVSPEYGFDAVASQSDWSAAADKTHYVTFYVGTGEGDDKSYVIIDGKKKDSTAVRSDYADTQARLFIFSPNSRAWEISSPFAPIISSVSATNIDLTAPDVPALTFDYINASDSDFTLAASQYGTAEDYKFAAGDFTVNADASSGTITLSADAIRKVDWAAENAYITVSNSSGTYKQNITVKSGEAPVFVGAKPEFKLEYGNIDTDVTVDFTYADADTPQLSRSLAPYDYTVFGREDIAADSSKYVYEKTDGNTYRLTLKKEFLAQAEQGTHYYKITTKNGSLEFPIFTAATCAWATRAAKGTIEPSGESDNYLSVHLNGFENGDISKGGRMFYSQPLDVTKPIFIEYGKYTENGWLLFDLNDNPYGIEYCNEVSAETPSKIKILDMVANASESPRWGASAGFVTNGVVNIGGYLNKYNNNVIEIGIGARSRDTYLKLNGHDITSNFTVSVKRDDFAGGFAYLSMFAGNSRNLGTSFEINKHVNAVAVDYSEYDEPVYALKSGDDLNFKVVNLKDNDLKVSYGGVELVKDRDWMTSGETLIIMGDYLNTVPFTTEMVFTLSSGGTSTEAHVPTVVAAGSSDAGVASGESAIKYYENADLTYRFSLGSESFIGVVDKFAETTLSAEDYTFADGALTLRQSFFAGREKGVCSLLLETNRGFVPFYALNYGFENGYATAGVSATLSDLTFDVSGGGSLVLEKLQDLTAGVEAEFAFKEVLGYYLTGGSTGNPDSYVAITFYDVENETEAVFRIRPNGEQDKANPRDKLYGEIEVRDRGGNSLAFYGNSLRLDVFGTHKLKMSLTDGALVFAVGDEPQISLDLEGVAFGGKNLLCSAQTLSGDGDAKMAYTLRVSADALPGGNGGDNSGGDNGDNGGSGDKNVKGCGCGGSIGVTATASALAMLAIAAVLVRRRGKITK